MVGVKFFVNFCLAQSYKRERMVTKGRPTGEKCKFVKPSGDLTGPGSKNKSKGGGPGQKSVKRTFSQRYRK